MMVVFSITCSGYRTPDTARSPSNGLIRNSYAGLDSCVIRDSRSRSLPEILFRGDGIEQFPEFRTPLVPQLTILCLYSTALGPRTGQYVFLATIRVFFHATCHAGHVHPLWILTMRNTLPRPIGPPILSP